MLGASPTQYRCLLQTEKLIEKRALEGKNISVNLSLAAGWFFCFIISIPLTAIPLFFPIDIFSYALMGITLVYDDNKLLDEPILRHPSETDKLSCHCSHASIIAHLLSRKTNAAPKAYNPVVSLSKSDACYRWYLDSHARVFSVPVLFSAGLLACRLHVRFLHSWRDDDIRGVLDKTIHQKDVPKYCAIRTAYISGLLTPNVHPPLLPITRRLNG